MTNGRTVHEMMKISAQDVCSLFFLRSRRKNLSTKQRGDRRDNWLWQPSMFVLLLLLEWLLQLHKVSAHREDRSGGCSLVLDLTTCESKLSWPNRDSWIKGSVGQTSHKKTSDIPNPNPLHNSL